MTEEHTRHEYLSPTGDQGGRVKRAIAGAFGSAAADYDRSGVHFFGLFASRLVEHLEPQHGWHVLDVGSGRGAVVFPLVDAVGADGRVTAVDLAEPMVQALADDLSARGVTAVDVRQGDVEALDLPAESVDAVTASMVLFFLPDLDRGLRSIHRVLRPGGVLAFTLFGDTDPRWQSVYDAFLPFLPDAEPGEDISRPRHPQLETTSGVLETVQRAGFVDVRCLEEVHPVRFASLEQWEAWSWSCGLRGAWMEMPGSVRDEARAAVLRTVESMRDERGELVESFSVRIVLAVKPAA